MCLIHVLNLLLYKSLLQAVNCTRTKFGERGFCFAGVVARSSLPVATSSSYKYRTEFWGLIMY